MVITPFTYVNSINTKKDPDIINENEKQYNSFIINRSLSYFQDTILLSNEMNINHHLDKLLQFHFLLNTVRKRKRFSKWVKPEIVDDLEIVKEFYGYSTEKAYQILPLLTNEQLQIIKNKIKKGGRSGK